VRDGDYLKRAFVRLETANTSVVVTMNMQAGANTEEFKVESLHGTYTLDNLVDLTKIKDGVKTFEGFSDWTTTLEKRGFEPMVERFLEAVEIMEHSSDYIKAMMHLKQQKVYKSHEIIHNILKEYGY
jgi:virulence factor